MAKEDEKKPKDKTPRVKDVQRGAWNPESISEVKYKAQMGKHRIRGCGTPRKYPNFEAILQGALWIAASFCALHRSKTFVIVPVLPLVG